MQRDEKGKIIFPYTLNGMGEIDIARKIYPLPPGTAFFVDIPSRHRYYFPEKGEDWEFIFLTIYWNEEYVQQGATTLGIYLPHHLRR